jgi:hypothetical protein
VPACHSVTLSTSSPGRADVKRATQDATQSGLGILRGFREDLDDDALQRMTDLVAAELFGDFLTQADHLHGQGFHVAAASVGGAVLERDLRARCQARDIKVKSNDGIGSLNQKLVSAQPQEYSAVTSKKIDTWGKIRNEADHGHFDDIHSPALAGRGRYVKGRPRFRGVAPAVEDARPAGALSRAPRVLVMCSWCAPNPRARAPLTPTRRYATAGRKPKDLGGMRTSWRHR